MFSQFTRIAFRSSEKEMWTIDREFSFIMPLFISVKYEMNTEQWTWTRCNDYYYVRDE